MNYVGNMVKAGGVQCSDEQIEARKKTCEGCEFKGKVNPLPLLEMDGCTECGCPFTTKWKFLEMLRIPEKAGTPLTPEEVILIAKRRAINGKLVKEKVTCPHPDGNKWSE